MAKVGATDSVFQLYPQRTAEPQAQPALDTGRGVKVTVTLSPHHIAHLDGLVLERRNAGERGADRGQLLRALVDRLIAGDVTL